MMGRAGAGARSEGSAASDVRCGLAASIRQVAHRKAFGKSLRGAGDVPDHPVQCVRLVTARRILDVMENDHIARERRRWGRGVAALNPIKLESRRDVASAAGMLLWNLAAVGPRRGRHREYGARGSAPASGPTALATGGRRRLRCSNDG